jgi:dephospho-CoA kinase
VKLVGLGGGIGAGKSTVSLLLAAQGAVIVDADLIARQVVEPGGPCLDRMVDRWGAAILNEDGSLNRAAMAGLVFGHPDELQALNAITHPAIGDEIARQIAVHVGSDRLVILDAALLFGAPRVGMVGRMLVDVDPEVAIERLIRFRGFSESDARARVASQMSRADRLALADFVIDNSGTHDALMGEVERALVWIAALPESPIDDPSGAPIGASSPYRSNPASDGA